MKFPLHSPIDDVETLLSCAFRCVAKLAEEDKGTWELPVVKRWAVVKETWEIPVVKRWAVVVGKSPFSKTVR